MDYFFGGRAIQKMMAPTIAKARTTSKMTYNIRVCPLRLSVALIRRIGRATHACPEPRSEYGPAGASGRPRARR